jgi:Ni,Fe-hydrogenase III component G
MRITIPDEELKTRLEERTKINVKKQLLAEFIEYLEADVGQWISDNLKSFERKLREEGRLLQP